VYESAYHETGVGYTTALKLMQNMYGKRLVTREMRGRQHVYEAAVPRDSTLVAVARRVIDRTFGGSAGALALHALGTERATSVELAEIKRLIRRLERDEESSRGSGR
jgi:predicted transcriptional regulator